MLPLCKFYRYLIYRLYHFRNDTPTFNVIITLTGIHWAQLLDVLYIIDTFTPFQVAPDWSKYNPAVSALLFGVINFILLYNKKKWKSYDEEFKNESPRDKKIGLILVLTYLIGTIILSFVLMIVVG